MEMHHYKLTKENYMKLLLLLLMGINLLFSSELSIFSKIKVENNWKINYKINSQQDINKTVLVYDGNDIDTTIIKTPNQNLSTVVMFLVDTSVPMKKEFNKGIKASIVNIFSLKDSWDKWAIAGFADKITIFGDYNQTNPSNALNKIVVSGQRTELYRAALEAIKSLKSQDSKRKYLFLFSDGQAEDNSYTYTEVIAKAKAAKVTIMGFGYKDSIYLQSLRRISEETGGKLYIADKHNHQLPSHYKEDLKSILDNAFEISFNSAVLQANTKGKVNVELKIFFENNTSVSKSISLKVKKLPPIIIKKKNYTPYYILIGIVAIIVLFFIFRPKKEEEMEEEIVVPEPIAYFQSASGAKQYVYKTHSSIGALAENDIVIEGEYISRHHATLDLKDGEFHLIDNNSSNKVFINYKEILNSKIKDGDIVSFGPYEVTFRIASE